VGTRSATKLHGIQGGGAAQGQEHEEGAGTQSSSSSSSSTPDSTTSRATIHLETGGGHASSASSSRSSSIPSSVPSSVPSLPSSCQGYPVYHGGRYPTPPSSSADGSHEEGGSRRSSSSNHSNVTLPPPGGTSRKRQNSSDGSDGADIDADADAGTDAYGGTSSIMQLGHKIGRGLRKALMMPVLIQSPPQSRPHLHVDSATDGSGGRQGGAGSRPPSYTTPDSSGIGGIGGGSSSSPYLLDFGKLQLLDQIGIGASSQVYKGTLSRCIPVAIKKLQVPPHDRRSFLELATREASHLFQLKHSTIVTFYGISAATSGPPLNLAFVYLVTELCATSLDRMYTLPLSMSGIDEMVFLRLALQVADGMAYIHERNVTHRDLKPGNILLSELDWSMGAQPKICDFGMSKLLVGEQSATMTANLGTPSFMAPELLTDFQSNTKYNAKAVDIYSYGVILNAVWSRSVPYADLQFRTVYHKLSAVSEGLRPNIEPQMPPRLKQLVTKCWHADPHKRPDFHIISQELQDVALLEPIDHDYISSFDDAQLRDMQFHSFQTPE